jgi:hypothetical protein
MHSCTLGEQINGHGRSLNHSLMQKNIWKVKLNQSEGSMDSKGSTIDIMQLYTVPIIAQERPSHHFCQKKDLT